MEKIYCIIGATSDIGIAYLKELEKQNEKIKVIAIYFGDKEKLENFLNEF